MSNKNNGWKERNEGGWGEFFSDPGVLVILCLIGMVIYGLANLGK